MDRAKALSALEASTKLLEEAMGKLREAHKALGQGPEVGGARGSMVVVDAGHGGKDPGAVSGGAEEKLLALAIAKLLSKQLRARGFRVKETRTTDTFVEITERTRIANEEEAEVFVSVHLNASPSWVSSGPWVLHAKPSKKGEELARKICAEIGNRCKVFPDESDAVSGRRLGVLRGTSMPAVLVECGFITNSVDLSNLLDSTYQALLAEQISKGVERYLEESV
jgi:N-acetylmuramoyl-L-alanine amidase